MKTARIEIAKFKSESEEADWWASPEGRTFARQRSAELLKTGKTLEGSKLVAKLNTKPTVRASDTRPC